MCKCTCWKFLPILDPKGNVLVIVSRSVRTLKNQYGGFLKWWYPTTMGFPTTNDHFGVFWGYCHWIKHPYGNGKSWCSIEIDIFKWSSLSWTPCYQRVSNKSLILENNWSQTTPELIQLLTWVIINSRSISRSPEKIYKHTFIYPLTPALYQNAPCQPFWICLRCFFLNKTSSRNGGVKWWWIPRFLSVKHHVLTNKRKQLNATAKAVWRPRDAPGCAGVLSPPLDPWRRTCEFIRLLAMRKNKSKLAELI